MRGTKDADSQFCHFTQISKQRYRKGKSRGISAFLVRLSYFDECLSSLAVNNGRGLFCVSSVDSHDVSPLAVLELDLATETPSIGLTDGNRLHGRMAVRPIA